MQLLIHCFYLDAQHYIYKTKIIPINMTWCVLLYRSIVKHFQLTVFYNIIFLQLQNTHIALYIKGKYRTRLYHYFLITNICSHINGDKLAIKHRIQKTFKNSCFPLRFENTNRIHHHPAESLEFLQAFNCFYF